MAKRTVLLLVTLLASALLAAGGVAVALILLGHDMFGPNVHAISQARVRQELAAHRSVTSSGPASGSPGHHVTSSASPAATAEPSARNFIGGTVYASCSAGQVLITQRVPAPGYAIESVSPGPATAAWVRFSSGGSGELVTVRCAGGQPSFTAATDQAGNDEKHGGGGGGRGGSGGGGGSGGHGGGDG